MAGVGHQAGIYYHLQSGMVRRVAVGMTPPDGEGWELLSSDPNTSLVAARELIRQRNGGTNEAQVQWG